MLILLLAFFLLKNYLHSFLNNTNVNWLSDQFLQW
jgi:hypothetical protein